MTCLVYFEDFPGEASVLNERVVNETREFDFVCEHSKLMMISWLWDGVLDACFFLTVGVVITWEKGCIQLGEQQEHRCHLRGWGCSRHDCCSITPPPCLQAHSELADGKTEVGRRGEA